MVTKAERKPVSLPVPAIIMGIFFALAGSAFWYLQQRGSTGSAKPVLTAEAKAYVRNLQLAGVEMKATESYLGQEVVEITGKITNGGRRPLQQVDLNCVFYDPYGQVVLRELVSIVRAKEGGLKPGDTKEFRLPFEGLAQSWNKGMPQLVIARIIF